MKIGILGGSFDPLHNGHLFMAKNAYEQYNLDEIWLIPNGQAPHKDANKMADPLQRFTMCKMAETCIPYIRACDIEIVYKYKWETMTFNVFEMGTEEAVHNAFQVLSDGGVVLEPIGELPWSKCCATVIDKFGVCWWISI